MELGGSDQRFNVLMGRDYQRNQGQRPQVGMLLPIITGTCGSQKMSKSLNNYIGILDAPFDKFGKVMSIPDEIMLEYYKYVSGLSEDKYTAIESGLKSGDLHPNEVKKDLGQMIVSMFHGDETGKEMRVQFENVFKKKKLPDEVPEFKIESEMPIVDLLVTSSLLSSKGEARRMIQQNAVSIVDGEKVTSIDFTLGTSDQGKVVKVGKRKFFEACLIMRKSDLKKAFLYLKNNLDLDAELELSIDQLVDKVEELKMSCPEISTDKGLGLPSEFSDFTNPIGLFTDGACRGNPGPGAWAAVLQENDKEFVFEMAGHEEETTNNRMELDAVISGLKEILILEEENRLSMKDRDLLVFSDSKYVLDGIQKWTKGWKARGWKKLMVNPLKTFHDGWS